MGVHGPVEVAKTVLEVADLAFTAVEYCHHHRHHDAKPDEATLSPSDEEEEKRNLRSLESLRSENQRLRMLLKQNLQLLGNVSRSPSFSQSCPSDLHERLLSAVSSDIFLKKLESNIRDTDSKFPFKNVNVADVEVLEVPIYVEHKDPSWWVWVSEDMTPSNTEEKSGLDNDNYVVVSEDVVVDGVANFIAKCIVSNTRAKNLTPRELQEAITKVLGGVNKVGMLLQIWNAGHLFLTLGSWGLALAGLYRSPAILRYGALGVHTASKIVLKAI